MNNNNMRLMTMATLMAIMVLQIACGNSTPPPSTVSENTVPVVTEEPTTVPPLLPDLQITDVRIDPKPIVRNGISTLEKGKTYSFTFEITNSGQGSVPDQAFVEVSIGYICEYPLETIASPEAGVTGIQGPIGSGESRLTQVLKFLFPVELEPGTCTFRYAVDLHNKILEVNDSNNERMENVEVNWINKK